MSPTWIFGFCCICSVDITPSWGCCGVEHRLHGLSLQGERLIWGVVLGQAKLPSVFDFGYVSILFFLSVKVSGAGEGRAEGRENALQVSHKCYFFGCGMPGLSDIVNLLPMNPRTQKKAFPRWCSLWILFTHNIDILSFHSRSACLEWLCALATHCLMTLCYTVPALDTFYEYYSDFHFSFLVDTGWLLPWALILLLNSSFWLVSPTTLPCSWVCVCVCVCVCV